MDGFGSISFKRPNPRRLSQPATVERFKRRRRAMAAAVMRRRRKRAIYAIIGSARRLAMRLALLGRFLAHLRFNHLWTVRAETPAASAISPTDQPSRRRAAISSRT
jgi:hypothetical protein